MGFFTGTLVWILLVVLVGKFASSRNRSFWGYFWLSFFLSPLVGFLVALIAGPKYVPVVHYEEEKKCPYCSSYIPKTASVCGNCGRDLYSSYSDKPLSSNISYISSSSEAEEKWYCKKCGVANLKSVNTCLSCKTSRWLYEYLSEEDKKTVDDYIDQISKLDTKEDIVKKQNLFFGTSSLYWMELVLPNINSFEDIKLYKEKFNEYRKESPSNNTEAEINVEEPKTENVTSSENIVEDQKEQLIKVKELFDNGLIDEDEYKQKKAKILGL